MEKNSGETLIALVIAMIGAAMMPKTETTISTEKNTLVSLLAPAKMTSGDHLHNNCADVCDMALPEKLEPKPESQCKA